MGGNFKSPEQNTSDKVNTSMSIKKNYFISNTDNFLKKEKNNKCYGSMEVKRMNPYCLHRLPLSSSLYGVYHFPNIFYVC